MNKILLIRIPPPVYVLNLTTHLEWGLFTKQGELIDDIHICTLQQLKEQINLKLPDVFIDDDAELDVVLFLPSTMVFNNKLPIKEGQKKYLATALPFIVEEHLARDVDEMHIQSLSIAKTNLIEVSAISHGLMQHILQLFSSCNVPLTSITAEAQYFPSVPNQTLIFLDSGAAIVSSDEGEGIVMSYDALNCMLTNPLQEKHTEIEIDSKEISKESITNSQIQLFYSEYMVSVSNDQIEALIQHSVDNGFLVTATTMQTSILEYTAKHYTTKIAKDLIIELRQGSYRCFKQAFGFFKRWKPVMIALIAWFFIDISFSIGSGFWFKSQESDIWNHGMQRYLQWFPNDSQAKKALSSNQRYFDVQLMIENRLKNNQSFANNKLFIPSWYKLSEIIDTFVMEKKLKPMMVDFTGSNGNIVTQVSVLNKDILDQLLNQIRVSGFKIQLNNQHQDKSEIVAQLIISE